MKVIRRMCTFSFLIFIAACGGDSSTSGGASLVRDADSKPVIVSSVSGTSGSFNGAAGYTKEATASGIIYGQVYPDDIKRNKSMRNIT
jgi:hypothetical protein